MADQPDVDPRDNQTVEQRKLPFEGGIERPS